MAKMRNLLPGGLSPAAFVAVLTVLLLGSTSIPRHAWSGGAQREVKINTFNGLPIEIVEVRNLQKGEDWFRDLEIEVKNVSDKPVYALAMTMTFPDIPASPPVPRPDGKMPTKVLTGFPLKFGDPRLLSLKNLAAPEDVPIKPGETYVFRMPPERVTGLESMKKNRGFTSADIKKIELELDVISFGDGTGFIGPRKKDYR